LIPRLGCPRSPGQPRVPARPGPPYRPRPVPPSRLLPRARPARPPGRRGPPRPGRQLCQWRLHLANGSGGGRSWSLAGDLPFRARWSPWRRAHGHVTAGGTGVALLLPRSRAGATLRCRTVCVRAITSNRTAPGESDPHPVPVSGWDDEEHDLAARRRCREGPPIAPVGPSASQCARSRRRNVER